MQSTGFNTVSGYAFPDTNSFKIQSGLQAFSWKIREKNRGRAGVDGMEVEGLRPYLGSHWTELRARLLAGTCEPRPVKRVEIPKPDGGKRPLGIPAVLDRFVQQALAQVLTPVFDPGFSASS